MSLKITGLYACEKPAYRLCRLLTTYSELMPSSGNLCSIVVGRGPCRRRNRRWCPTFWNCPIRSAGPADGKFFRQLELVFEEKCHVPAFQVQIASPIGRTGREIVVRAGRSLAQLLPVQVIVDVLHTHGEGRCQAEQRITLKQSQFGGFTVKWSISTCRDCNYK